MDFLSHHIESPSLIHGAQLLTAADRGKRLWVKLDGEPTWFVDPDRGIRRMLVDAEGLICNFPGCGNNIKFRSTEELNQVSPDTGFELTDDGRFCLLWNINSPEMHPNDWTEENLDVCLYSVLDENGHFTAPFQLYRLGDIRYMVYDGSREGFWEAAQYWFVKNIREAYDHGSRFQTEYCVAARLPGTEDSIQLCLQLDDCRKRATLHFWACFQNAPSVWIRVYEGDFSQLCIENTRMMDSAFLQLRQAVEQGGGCVQ